MFFLSPFVKWTQGVGSWSLRSFPMPGKSCFPGQKQIKTAITEMAMTEISFLGEYSAHSSPREIRGSSSDLLCRTRHFRCRHTQNPSAASPFPQSCCLALLSGTDVCRASIRFICPYSSTCRVLLSRGNPHFCTLVQFRGSRGEKVVTSDRKQRGKRINENSAECLCAHTKQRSHSEKVAIRCHSHASDRCHWRENLPDEYARAAIFRP